MILYDIFNLILIIKIVGLLSIYKIASFLLSIYTDHTVCLPTNLTSPLHSLHTLLGYN